MVIFIQEDYDAHRSDSRISLGHLPTPVHALPRLTDMLGGPQLFIKRDDQTGLATGGNKTRKLEFLVADALEHRADTLITAGAPQSNHARQTAAAAARMGMKCVLVLRGQPPAESQGNLLLDQLLGAQIRCESAVRLR
jgi:D-cysteine desulfhydrase